MVQRIDYDRIAGRYDAERHRSRRVDPDLVAWLQAHAGRQPGDVSILDVGCGTGNQLVADHRLLPKARMVGLDLHRGMLEQAQQKIRGVAWVQGDAAHIPFRDEAFDLVTNQFAFHHVLDKPAMIRDVLRVLRPEGRFVMTNIDPGQMAGWVIYRYFPAAWARDLQDFPTVRDLEAMLRDAGFAAVEITTERQETEEDLAELYSVVRMRVTSQLLVIAEGEYRRGLTQIEARLMRAHGRPVHVPTEVCLLKATADRSG